MEPQAVVQLEVMAYSSQTEIQVRHLFSNLRYRLKTQLVMQEGLRQQVYSKILKIQIPHKNHCLAGLHKDHKIQQFNQQRHSGPLALLQHQLIQ